MFGLREISSADRALSWRQASPWTEFQELSTVTILPSNLVTIISIIKELQNSFPVPFKLSLFTQLNQVWIWGCLSWLLRQNKPNPHPGFFLHIFLFVRKSLHTAEYRGARLTIGWFEIPYGSILPSKALLTGWWFCVRETTQT
jgi:hypothetical protein